MTKMTAGHLGSSGDWISEAIAPAKDPEEWKVADLSTGRIEELKKKVKKVIAKAEESVPYDPADAVAVKLADKIHRKLKEELPADEEGWSPDRPVIKSKVMDRAKAKAAAEKAAVDELASLRDALYGERYLGRESA